MNKTAIVIGPTGLVGSAIAHALIKDPEFEEVVILHRRASGINHNKVREYIIDFDKPSTYETLIKSDVLFSSLGTTIKKAGSQDAQYKIDYQYQYEMAKSAAESGVRNYVLISSAGANGSSRNFYSRMKGELENSVKKLPFDKIVILQPSILDGPRTEFRLMERIGIVIAKMLSWIPGIRAYRPIHADIVAQAAINSLKKSKDRVATYKLEEIFVIAKERF